MGRTILCPHCKSTFDEDVLARRADPNRCPVCEENLGGTDKSLNGDAECNTDTAANQPNASEEEPLTFGDGIELGENDSFDEDKIDFWWYSIREPGEVWKGITFETGDVSTNCTKCGCFSGAPYPIARTKDYLLISPRFTVRCSNCGNELKNHILSKRPADWVDPRKKDMSAEEENIPRCPVCNSTKIRKISMTNKAVSALTFGILAAGHVSKTYKCGNCGAKF